MLHSICHLYSLKSYGDHQHLHSFPTRRSSDLDYDNDGFLDLFLTSLDGTDPALYHNRGDGTFELDGRSEEHTSELQSRVDVVCRLLLEKKKGVRAQQAAVHEVEGVVHGARRVV